MIRASAASRERDAKQALPDGVAPGRYIVFYERSVANVEFEGAIPDAKLGVILAAGHLSNLEQPEQFNEAVRQFCRAHSPRQ